MVRVRVVVFRSNPRPQPNQLGARWLRTSTHGHEAVQLISPVEHSDGRGRAWLEFGLGSGSGSGLGLRLGLRLGLGLEFCVRVRVCKR